MNSGAALSVPTFAALSASVAYAVRNITQRRASSTALSALSTSSSTPPVAGNRSKEFHSVCVFCGSSCVSMVANVATLQVVMPLTSAAAGNRRGARRESVMLRLRVFSVRPAAHWRLFAANSALLTSKRASSSFGAPERRRGARPPEAAVGLWRRFRRHHGPRGTGAQRARAPARIRAWPVTCARGGADHSCRVWTGTAVKLKASSPRCVPNQPRHARSLTSRGTGAGSQRALWQRGAAWQRGGDAHDARAQGPHGVAVLRLCCAPWRVRARRGALWWHWSDTCAGRPGLAHSRSCWR